MARVIQNRIIDREALTVSGGATPSKAAESNLAYSVSSISLVLLNSGASTSLTVTYKIGYKNVDGTFTYITPADGGAIADFTAVNIAGSSKHTSISVAPAEKYQFTITNNDAGNAANVTLISMIQQGL